MKKLFAAGFLGLLASLLVPSSTIAGPTFDPTPYVDPDLRAELPRIQARVGQPFNDQLIAQVRKMPADTRPLPDWTKETIAGVPGSPDVTVWVGYAGRKARPRAAVLYIHGGGYVVGSGRGGTPLLTQIATELDAVIVSVDYRLAPETRFPGSLNDTYAALRWLHANAERLGADPTRIAVLGDSAGGGHAAMLAIAARDRGEKLIAFQALIYPMLDDRTGVTRDPPPWQGALVWTRANNRYGWTSLLGVPAGSQRVPYGSVPARVDDLRGLPPTWIGVGSIDLFLEEDLEYARRLLAAGVTTQLDVYPGAFHGFPTFSQGRLAMKLRADVVDALRWGLAVGR